MSRIGKKPIQIPQGVEVSIKENVVETKGPKGALSCVVPFELSVEKKENELLFDVKKQTKTSSALWGLFRSLVQNNVIGVSDGFQKQLEIIGVGFKANVEGKNLNLSLGFSHPVKLEIPEGLAVVVEKNIITITGIDKQKVGQFTAVIRALKKPEPYKGKGIRYVGEKVRRKEGKKAAAGK